MNPTSVAISPPVLRVRHAGVRLAEHRYIMDVLLREHLGLEYEPEAVPGLPCVEIDFPGAGPGRVVQVGANLLLRPDEQWLSAAAVPLLPLERWDSRSLLPAWNSDPLPVLFPPSTQPTRGSKQRGTLFLPVDIFGGAFYLLTRYEEVVVKERDRHGRFPTKESVACKAGFLRRPLVDEYSHLLGLALSACFPGLECRRRPPRIRLSHDVDHPYQFFGTSVPHMAYNAGKWLYRHPSLRGACRLAVAGVRSGLVGDISSDPFNTYASLMSAGEALGVPSEFYFMTSQRGQRYQEAYDLEQPELQDLLREVHRRGHIIGLHASYDSFRSASMLGQERDRLVSGAKRAGIRLESVGGRQHYLRWEHPTSWQAWEKAGLAYDGTLGFPDEVGFRCGTSREYPVFDPVTAELLRLRERPLAVMDVAMSDTMALDRVETVKTLESLWAAVSRVGGTLEVLVHNCNPQAAWLAQLCVGLRMGGRVELEAPLGSHT